MCWKQSSKSIIFCLVFHKIISWHTFLLTCWVVDNTWYDVHISVNVNFFSENYKQLIACKDYCISTLIFTILPMKLALACTYLPLKIPSKLLRNILNCHNPSPKSKVQSLKSKVKWTSIDSILLCWMCQNSILESGLWQSRVQVFFCLILLSSSCCCCCFWIIYYSWVFHNISTRTRPFVTSFCRVQCIAFLCVCFCVESMKECDVTATAHNALCTQLRPFLLPSSSRKWKKHKLCLIDKSNKRSGQYGESWLKALSKDI